MTDTTTPPNVIFILADDMGFGDIACFGNDALRTPNLDRMARQGLALTQHYTASPICAPARAGLLTGRYPHRTGAIDVPSNRGLDRIALDETTLADAFKAGGYRTGMLGKWHNGLHDQRYHPRSRGFDEFVGFCNGGMDYYNWILDNNGEFIKNDGRYLTDVFTDEALEFIDRHQQNPFLLYLAYNAPHSPLQAPDDRIDYYRKMNRFTEEVCRVYAMIEIMDEGIGRILDKLETLQLTKNTLVVFSTDNGPYLLGGQNRYNGPFSGMKTQVLEGGIRVPAIIQHPGKIPPGIVSEGYFHFCDWLPTLLSWCQLSHPGHKPLDGKDRSKDLMQPQSACDKPAPGDAAFWQVNRYNPIHHHNGAMRDGNWKLYWPEVEGASFKDMTEDQPSYEFGLTQPQPICDINPQMPARPLGNPVQPKLFDLQKDPAENEDLAADEPERLAQMIADYDRWFEAMMEDLQKVGGPPPVTPPCP
jgi:arylsulfatase A-like enzyme